LSGLGIALAVLAFYFPAAAQPTGTRPVFNVRDFGAQGNGAALETYRLQNAIDACGRAGGGQVLFPAGRYCSGTLFLRSGVTLRFEKDAVLSASRNLADYPRVSPELHSRTDNYTERSLIYGENLRGVGIEGEGALDGNGEAFFGPQLERPYLIRLISCKDVSIHGVTLRDAAMWAQHYLACENVSIKNLTVRSHRHLNNDGLDLDGCRNVVISGCDIRSEDDSIVLKSTCDHPCQNVEVSGCTLSSDNNALKLGTESSTGFQNISIHDCSIYDTKNSGLALEVVDGGKLDGVDVSNLTMRNVGAPIFVRLGNRARPVYAGASKPGMGSLENVRIHNIIATGAGHIGCSITGVPNFPVRNVALEDINITFRGGATGTGLRVVPENASKYPEHSMFGVLPAYGFYCRHVQNLTFTNVNVRFERNDSRPSLVCDDVAGLELTHWQGQTRTPDSRSFRFVNVSNARVDSAPFEENATSQPRAKRLPVFSKAG
jgi:polygalacturonase